MTDCLCSTLVCFIREIDSEAKLMKCLSNLRLVDVNSKESMMISMLDGDITDLEVQFDSLESMIDEELDLLTKFECLLSSCRKQKSSIELFHESISCQSRIENNVSRNDNDIPDSSILESEFELVPRSIRGKLPLSIVSNNLKLLWELDNRKSKVLVLGFLFLIITRILFSYSRNLEAK